MIGDQVLSQTRARRPDARSRPRPRCRSASAADWTASRPRSVSFSADRLFDRVEIGHIDEIDGQSPAQKYFAQEVAGCRDRHRAARSRDRRARALEDAPSPPPRREAKAAATAPPSSAASACSSAARFGLSLRV